MANVLYKVTAKKAFAKVPAGAWVEIMKTTAQSKPNASEIMKAFEAKGIKVPNGYVSSTYFDIVKL